MASTITGTTPLPYYNDGSGRDTFINYAGGYWMNPLPGGVYFKSMDEEPPRTETGAQSRRPAMDLFGKSRYGLTLKLAEKEEEEGTEGGATAHGGTIGGVETDLDATDIEDRQSVKFVPEKTALEHVPYDVSKPEQRLRQPGHAMTQVEDSNGESTYNGVRSAWAPPNAVDNTLLRLATTYESTCHYTLRTGRYFAEEEAPPREMTLPDKGVSWGKSRYY